jgi:hypothetical protein
MRTVRSWAALGLVVAVAGCGSPYVAVSGVVTLDGQPLPDATVTFLPGRGTEADVGSSYGRTGPDGRYTLTTIQMNRAGVGRGEHKVVISRLKSGGARLGDFDQVETLPARYNAKTELTFTVPPSGSDAANFELKSR